MVKRYEPDLKYIGTGDYVPKMTRAEDGDYVEASDYDALAARLAEAVDALRDLYDNEKWDDDDPRLARARAKAAAVLGAAVNEERSQGNG